MSVKKNISLHKSPFKKNVIPHNYTSETFSNQSRRRSRHRSCLHQRPTVMLIPGKKMIKKTRFVNKHKRTRNDHQLHTLISFTHINLSSLGAYTRFLSKPSYEIVPLSKDWHLNPSPVFVSPVLVGGGRRGQLTGKTGGERKRRKLLGLANWSSLQGNSLSLSRSRALVALYRGKNASSVRNFHASIIVDGSIIGRLERVLLLYIGIDARIN